MIRRRFLSLITASPLAPMLPRSMRPIFQLTYEGRTIPIPGHVMKLGELASIGFYSKTKGGKFLFYVSINGTDFGPFAGTGGPMGISRIGELAALESDS